MKNLISKTINCLLIHPGFSKNSALNYVEVCNIVGARYPIPPLGLITVAALLPKSWECKLIDLNCRELFDEDIAWADIIFTGGMLSQQPGILKVIERAHTHGKPVVVGGPEPTSQPELYSMVDYLVLGEGEETIPMFLEDYNNGITKGIYKSPKMAEISESALPRYDLIKFSDYMFMGIQYSRGCPYNCEFCNVIELFGRKPRTKSVNLIISELQQLYELDYRGHIFFVDDNFLANGKEVKELLKAIAGWSERRRYPFYFAAESSLDLAGKDDLLQLMKNAGFRYLSIGVETPEDEVLMLAQKDQNKNLAITEIMNKIFKYGIVVDASFILGFDNETEKTADNMMQCIQEAGICMAMVGTLFVLPNTQLSDRLKREGRLLAEGTIVRDTATEIDQMSSGLNFLTVREKAVILRDYVKILNYIYHPVNYYERLTYLGLRLKPASKYRPGPGGRLKMVKAFLRICSKAGFNRTTGSLFWKLLFTILVHNPRALEMVVGLAAMYIHLSGHSQFITELTNNRINVMEHQEAKNKASTPQI